MKKKLVRFSIIASTFVLNSIGIYADLATSVENTPSKGMTCNSKNGCPCGVNCKCSNDCDCKKQKQSESQTSKDYYLNHFHSDFVDVSKNHWAYKYISKMQQKGFISGETSKKFAGKKLLTRFEFACSINEIWKSLESELKSAKLIKQGILEVLDVIHSSELKELLEIVKKALSDSKLTSFTEDDLGNLSTLTSEFKKELIALRKPIKENQSLLDNLNVKVDALTNKLPVKITGDFNVLGMTSHVSKANIDTQTKHALSLSDDYYALAGNGSGIAGDSLLKNYQNFYEFNLGLAGELSDTWNWKGSIVFGNVLGDSRIEKNMTDYYKSKKMPAPFLLPMSMGGLGNYSHKSMGTLMNYDEIRSYVPEIRMAYHSNWNGFDVKGVFGRQGYQITDMLLKRSHANSMFYNNDRWNDGNYIFDGAKISASHDTYGSLTAFRGSTKVTGGPLTNPCTLVIKKPNGGYIADSVGLADTVFGLHYSHKLGGYGQLNLGLLDMSRDEKTDLCSGVYGGDAMFFVHPKVGFKVGLANAYYSENNKSLELKEAYASFGEVIYYTPELLGTFGYRMVGPNYTAPGNWAASSLVGSASNLKGFSGKTQWSATENLKLSALGEYLSGVNDDRKDNSLTLVGGHVQYSKCKKNFINGEVTYGHYNKNNADQSWLGFGTIYIDHKATKDSNVRIGYQYGQVNKTQNLVDFGLSGVTDDLSGGSIFVNYMIKF